MSKTNPRFYLIVKKLTIIIITMLAQISVLIVVSYHGWGAVRKLLVLLCSANIEEKKLKAKEEKLKANQEVREGTTYYAGDK
jgi:hypothetical protein